MPFTSYFDTKVLSLVIGQTSYVVPTNLFVALSSVPPSQTQAGSPPWNFNEPVGNSYARVQVPNNATNWGPAAAQPATGYAVTNKLSITYLQSSNPWLGGVPLPFFGLFDALTGGNLLVFGNCSPAQSVDAPNITLSIAAGALIATIN